MSSVENDHTRPPIRVAHVITIYRGVVGILEAKLLALDAMPDIEVTAITAPRPIDIDLPRPRVRHLEIPMARPIQPFADLRSLVALYRILRRERFDIVHSHSAKAGVVAALAARPAGLRHVLHTYHGLPFYEGQSAARNRCYRGMEHFTCRLRSEVWSQNRRDIPACVEMMGDAARVRYEGNGVDPEDVLARAKADLRRAEADFPPGRHRLAVISRLEAVKRVDDILNALHTLITEGLDVSTVIAGYGPMRADLERCIIRLGIEERVRLLGWCPHAPSLLMAADATVLASEKEGIPRSLIEAMALGKPVVATDVLGTQELVVDGETGFLVPLGDTRRLADRIAEVLRDDNLAGRFGRAGYDRMLAEFDDRRIAERLAARYRTLMGRDT